LRDGLGAARNCLATQRFSFVSFDLFDHSANRLHFNDEREDARLTNEGMLMILCLEVEELLKAICSTSLSDAFMSGKM
jgi:hypothetical protein